MNQPTFFVPKLLYGNCADTKVAWTYLVNLARDNSALFLTELNSLEKVDVFSHSGKIILRDLNQGCQKAVSHWRLNHVSEVFVKWWKSIERFELNNAYGPFQISSEFQNVDSASMLQQEIIIHASRYSWFVLAMLDPERNGPGFLFPGTQARDSFYLPLLRRFISCLPEFLTLLPRLYYGLGNILMPYQDVENPHCWWYLWSFLLTLVEIFRPSVTFNQMREILIPLTYNGNLIDALVGESIIRPSEGGYILNE
jgi:hypothetical protein